jgi:TolB-like protein
MSLFAELKRRNVLRVAAAYVVFSWLLLQMGDLQFDLMGLPDWSLRIVLGILILGFPVALIFAWVYELTPEGVRKESEIDPDRSITPQTGKKLDYVTLVALAGVVAFVLIERQGTEEPQPGVAEAPSPAVTEPATDPVGVSIAVLPFVNMSSDPEQDYFSDGITEELLNRLAKLPDLRVAARTSSFQFKGQNLDVANIGKTLNVDHILEGSVRKSGNRLRITAQLIAVGTGFHLWSETFERELTDVFAVQDEISSAIAAALKARLVDADGPSARSRAANVEAFDLYLRGRHLTYQRETANLRNAIGLFERAVAIDPQFAEAYGSMAFAWSLLPSYSRDVPPLEGLEATRRFGEMALSIDPENVEALTGLGHAETLYAWDFEKARSYFDRAMALAPGNAEVVNLFGDHLVVTGDFLQGLRIETLAHNLDPLSSVHSADLSALLGIVGRGERSLEYARISHAIAPNAASRIDTLVQALAINGHYESARQLIADSAGRLDEARRYEPRWRSMVAYQSGDDEQLRVWVNRLIDSKPGELDIFLSYVGLFLLHLDGAEAAMPWMERAYESREPWLVYSGYFYQRWRFSDDPAWQAFWSKPELKKLLDLRASHTEFPNAGSLWAPTTQDGRAEPEP